MKTLKNLKNKVTGLSFKSNVKFHNCQICNEAKMSRVKFPVSSSIAKEPLELIHSDISGPIQVPSIHKKEVYAVSFICDHSQYIKVYLMNNKSDFLEKFKQFNADIANQTKFKIKILHGDNGGEFISNELKQFCLSNGIKQEFTISYTPQQNEVAERSWRTLYNMVRCLLLESKLPSNWWGPALLAAVYLKNRTPHTKNKTTQMTPHEILFREKPDLSNLHIFGSKVTYWNPNPTKSKLDPKGLPGIFAGYPDRVKGYIIFNPSTKHFSISRNVKFMEHVDFKRYNSTFSFPLSTEDQKDIF
jgi:hypothetical protein